MRKLINISLFLMILSCFIFSTITTNPTTIYVGTNVTFDVDCHDSSSSPKWDFGDGTTASVPYDDSAVGTSRTHYYRNPGYYTVTYTRTSTSTWCTNPESLNINVLENRSITYSPSTIRIGQSVTFKAINFNTPSNLRWNMGDGTVYSPSSSKKIRGSSTITHTYKKPGSYTIKVYDWNGDTSTTAVTKTVYVANPERSIYYYPETPRVDQLVYFEAKNYMTNSITWEFGDGGTGNGKTTSYRYQNDGTFTVKASEVNDGELFYKTKSITVLPENRSLVISKPEVLINEEFTITALNFRGDYVLWDFGDGTQRLDFQTVTYKYDKAGTYTITARDEAGESRKTFSITIKVIGITDEVNLALAEIKLDNNKYYKIVPKNGKLKAVLRMKMKGTGIVNGEWIVDGVTYELFSEVAYEGVINEIYTRDIPGLPTTEPGMHTITIRLYRPEVEVTFPTLRYYVLPYSATIKTLTPMDSKVLKEDEIPEFSWQSDKNASYYKIVFSNYMYSIMNNDRFVKSFDVKGKESFKPDKELWNWLKRNVWVYWKVVGVDASGNTLAESDIQQMKIVVARADIKIDKISDLNGNKIGMDKGNVSTKEEYIMAKGSITYKDNAKFLILRVYANRKLVDQLLFRDVKKGEKRYFDTSIPNNGKETRVYFQVLKTSSPAVILGINTIKIKKN